MQIKTRFAPSPTGFIHIGNIRTALFSWLYSKKNEGDFFIRIDDTDEERNSNIYTNNILYILNWLNIKSNKEIFYQSKRYNIYKNILKILLKKKIAYKCYCNKERLLELKNKQLLNKEKIKYDGLCKNILNKNENFVIRMNNEAVDKIEFNDSVRGKILILKSEIDDFIIAKNNYYPTYNFASVIDDIDYEITDVIRGDDHISNTPKQIIIFKALNAKIPKFSHLPMILNENKKPLSKRDKESNINFYKNSGFLPNALLNYILRLGWSYKDKEIFTLDEMINLFNLENINKSPSIMNMSKLIWLNKYYIKNSSNRYLLLNILKIEKRFNLNFFIGPSLYNLIEINKNKVNLLEEIISKNIFLYEEKIKIDNDLLKIYFNEEIIIILQKIYKDIYNYTDTWNIENIKILINNYVNFFNLKIDKIASIFRIIITGNNNPNSIYEIFFLTGKILLLKKIKYIIKYYKMGL